MSCLDQVSNLVKGLSESGFVEEDLSEDYRQLLLKELLRVWNQMKDKDLTMTVLG
jgi:hypothetical protein